MGRGDQNILIAGYGDGALTDLMRVCLRDFLHKDLLLRVVRAIISSGDLQKIRNIESNAGAHDASYLMAQYGPSANLELPQVDQILYDLRKENRTVVLTGPGPNLFHPGASALNRLIASRLLRVGAFQHIPLTANERIEKGEPSDPAIARIVSETGIKFETILLRFGPEPTADKIHGLPPLLTTLEDRWSRLRPNDDITRQRLWDEFTPIAEDIENCCITFHPDPLDPHTGGLRNVIDIAISRLVQSNDLRIRSIHAFVGDTVRTKRALAHATRVLCRAPMVIFLLGDDMGQGNPGSMLLMGIRATVRRGLTFVIHDGSKGTPNWSKVPFNLKEQQIRSLKIDKESADELHSSLAAGARILKDTFGDYRDFSVFDIVRRPNRRTVAPTAGRLEVLMLCPFGEDYLRRIWKQLDLLLSDVAGTKLDVRRVIDETSPLLVSERLYELIRVVSLCFVDWTFARANVFFKLGVRLAVNREPPVCIVHRETSLLPGSDQETALRQLLPLIPYSFGSVQGTGATDFVKRLDTELRQRSSVIDDPDSVYIASRRNILLTHEYGRLSHVEEMQRRVDQMLGDDVVSMGRLPILYSDNLDRNCSPPLLWGIMRYRGLAAGL